MYLEHTRACLVVGLIALAVVTDRTTAFDSSTDDDGWRRPSLRRRPGLDARATPAAKRTAFGLAPP
jgi:hypothetical protein